MVKGFVALARPGQWIKNGFVVAPLIFSGKVGDTPLVLATLLAVALFCAASSFVYTINDVSDAERDRLHPRKKKRPVASGAITKGQAWVFATLLLSVQLFSLRLPPMFGLWVALYITLNVAYTYYLKKVPVVDIFTIAISFVLRVASGAAAIRVDLSEWMFITTLCLALFLASNKRRQELLNVGEATRAVLGRYNAALMERYGEISGTGALVFYSIFVVTAKPVLVVTIPLVLFGLFRYWYIVHCNDLGESPSEALMSDWPLLFTVAAWGGVCVYLLRNA